MNATDFGDPLTFPSHSCWDISLKNKKVNLVVALGVCTKCDENPSNRCYISL